MEDEEKISTSSWPLDSSNSLNLSSSPISINPDTLPIRLLNKAAYQTGSSTQMCLALHGSKSTSALKNSTEFHIWTSVLSIKIWLKLWDRKESNVGSS